VREAKKIPEKIKLGGFVSGARICHELKTKAAMNYFSVKNNSPKKPKYYI
jgi:hypothetical protein